MTNICAQNSKDELKQALRTSDFLPKEGCGRNPSHKPKVIPGCWSHTAVAALTGTSEREEILSQAWELGAPSPAPGDGGKAHCPLQSWLGAAARLSRAARGESAGWKISWDNGKEERGEVLLPGWRTALSDHLTAASGPSQPHSPDTVIHMETPTLNLCVETLSVWEKWRMSKRILQKFKNIAIMLKRPGYSLPISCLSHMAERRILLRKISFIREGAKKPE